MKKLLGKVIAQKPLLGVAMMSMMSSGGPYFLGKEEKIKKVWNPKKKEYEYVKESDIK